MGAVSRERHRKLELLERYRALRLDETLSELEPQAEAEADQDRYPWKGEFRSRDEILDLYKQRKKLDRRFMIDMLVVVVVLAGIVLNGKRIISIFAPRPTLPARTEAGAEAPAQSSAGENTGQKKSGQNKTGEKKKKNRKQAQPEEGAGEPQDG